MYENRGNGWFPCEPPTYSKKKRGCKVTSWNGRVYQRTLRRYYKNFMLIGSAAAMTRHFLY